MKVQAESDRDNWQPPQSSWRKTSDSAPIAMLFESPQAGSLWPPPDWTWAEQHDRENKEATEQPNGIGFTHDIDNTRSKKLCGPGLVHGQSQRKQTANENERLAFHFKASSGVMQRLRKHSKAPNSAATSNDRISSVLASSAPMKIAIANGALRKFGSDRRGLWLP
jgi:hypothetical protein